MISSSTAILRFAASSSSCSPATLASSFFSPMPPPFFLSGTTLAPARSSRNHPSTDLAEMLSLRPMSHGRIPERPSFKASRLVASG